MAYNINYKTEYCRSWLSGQACKYAEGCQYAHGQPELRKKTYAAGMGMAGMGVGGMGMYGYSSPVVPTPNIMQQQAPQFDPRKFKTQICRHWQTTGTCQLAASCKFAHGETELRQYAGGIGTSSAIQMGQQNGEANTIVTQSDQRGTKRPYNGADYGAGSVAADLNESNNSVFGSTLDYLYNELIRKNLRETADELYQEVYATINKYTSITAASNDGQQDQPDAKVLQ